MLKEDELRDNQDDIKDSVLLVNDNTWGKIYEIPLSKGNDNRLSIKFEDLIKVINFEKSYQNLYYKEALEKISVENQGDLDIFIELIPSRKNKCIIPSIYVETILGKISFAKDELFYENMKKEDLITCLKDEKIKYEYEFKARFIDFWLQKIKNFYPDYKYCSRNILYKALNEVEGNNDVRLDDELNFDVLNSNIIGTPSQNIKNIEKSHFFVYNIKIFNRSLKDIKKNYLLYFPSIEYFTEIKTDIKKNTSETVLLKLPMNEEKKMRLPFYLQDNTRAFLHTDPKIINIEFYPEKGEYYSGYK